MSDYHGLKRCEKCGSYIPSDWEQCGRCSRPIPEERRSFGRGWAFLLILAFMAYVFRGNIGQLAGDPFSIMDRRNISSRTGAEEIKEEGHARPDPTVIPYPDENSGQRSDQDLKDSVTGTDSGIEEFFRSAGPKAGEAGNRNGGLNETAGISYGEKTDKIRELIRKALKNAEERLTLPVLGTDNDSRIVFDIIEEIVMDDPEIMFYDGARYRTDGQLTLNYSKDRDYILGAVKETVRRADEILGRIIKPGMSDFEKELAIHDYIVNNCRYDIEGLREGAIPPESHTAYGVLVKGTAVCEGYASAMKLLLDKAKIPCIIVTGHSKGEPHAWNMVCLGGQYYHVDATWDDPDMASGEQTLSHVYFNLMDDDMVKDHSWDRGDYPRCVSDKYNYYHYFGLTTNSPEGFTVLLDEAIKSGKDHISIRITNYNKGTYNIEKLLRDAAYRWVLGSISYRVNDLFGVVDIQTW